MNNITNIWVRGITGIATAGLIIAGTSMVYPMTKINLAGHILGWILAGFVGIKITLSAFEDEESWMEGSLETEAEAVAELPLIERRATPATVESPRFEHTGRFSWKLKEEPVLAHSGRLDRARIVAGSSFHRPEMEEKKECIRFAAENPICSLATIDEDNPEQPHVRTVFLWRADDSGFFFVLFSSKSVSRQVKAHPDVELCFQNHPGDISDARQLRVHGHLDLLENRKLKEEAARDRSILNTLAGDGENANIEVYHLSDFEMKFWQMGVTTNQAAEAVVS